MASTRIIVLASLLLFAMAISSVTADEDYLTKNVHKTSDVFEKVPKTAEEDYLTKKVPKMSDVFEKVPKKAEEDYLTKKVTAQEDYPTKKVSKTSVVVEGQVYCQSCKEQGTSSLSEAKPISGAKISVICKSHRNRVFYYSSYTTNEYGYFYAKLEGYTMGHYLLEHPLTACKVKLVSSSQENCNIPTNINYGISGASLRYENKRVLKKDCDSVIYASGPLAFRPAQCTPETHY